MKQYSKAVIKTVLFIIWNNRIEKSQDYENVCSNMDKQFSRDVLELIELIRDNGECWFEEKYGVSIIDGEIK